ncbi:hypothetical protein LCGC14_0867810 [marine sediment metagenome]|uniref:LamG-like jellyroll fold domain-containing protein n=1 Tax=marine sediment metagenome TaxID=412755 RepID=A0A0F9RQ61_9ZZZZ
MRKILLLSLLFIVLLVPLISAQEVYYRLESAAEANGKTRLTLVNSPTFVSGKIGDAISLDGVDQYATANVSSDLAFTTALTINYWMFPTDVSSSNNMLVIYNHDSEDIISFDEISTGHVQGIRVDSNIGNNQKFDLRYDPLLKDDQWYMVTLVLDGTNARLYVNATEADSAAVTEDFSPAMDTLKIGGDWSDSVFFTGLIDDVSIFSEAKDQAWIDERWNGGDGRGLDVNVPFFNGSTLDGNLTLVYDNITWHFNVSSFNASNIFNLTSVSITLDGVFFNETAMNQSFYIGNYSWDVSNNATGNHTINIIACDELNNCATIDYLYYKYGEDHSFKEETVEDVPEDITLILNLTGTPYGPSDIDIVLIYNHTKFQATSTGTKVISYEATVITPNITSAFDIIDFYWEYNISTNVFNSTNQTMNVGKLLLTECGDPYNTHALNISILNATEQTQGVTVSNLDQTYQVFDGAGVAYRSFNFTNTSTANFTLCIFPNTTVITDFQIEYIYGGISFTYFGDQINLSNVTKTLDLFVADGTSQITYNVVDFSENAVEGAFIIVDQYDIGTNSFSTVEILKTDADGDAVGRATLSTVWYRFTVTFGGETKLIQGPLKLTSTTKIFKIDIAGADWTASWINSNTVAYALGFNNVTKTFHLNYSDSQLVLDEICLKVVNGSIKGNVVLYENCETNPTTSGQLLATAINGVVDNQIFIATAWSIVSGDRFYIGALEANFLRAWRFYDNDGEGMGLFITMILVLAMFMLGIWHPAVSIIFGIIGFGVARILGLQIMTWPMFVTLIVLGIITVVRINRAK